MTVSLPADVAEEIQRAVEAGAAKDASAFVASAVRRYRRRLTPDETLAVIRQDFGELPAEALEWASRVRESAARRSA